jgi:hypothetical protein
MCAELGWFAGAGSFEDRLPIWQAARRLNFFRNSYNAQRMSPSLDIRDHSVRCM